MNFARKKEELQQNIMTPGQETEQSVGMVDTASPIAVPEFSADGARTPAP